MIDILAFSREEIETEFHKIRKIIVKLEDNETMIKRKEALDKLGESLIQNYIDLQNPQGIINQSIN